jgi:hypothetical protein
VGLLELAVGEGACGVAGAGDLGPGVAGDGPGEGDAGRDAAGLGVVDTDVVVPLPLVGGTVCDSTCARSPPLPLGLPLPRDGVGV